jgi:hypothetical protein
LFLSTLEITCGCQRVIVMLVFDVDIVASYHINPWIRWKVRYSLAHTKRLRLGKPKGWKEQGGMEKINR